MTGQAESAPETGGLDDLASFLSESPETDSIDEENEAETVDESTGEADTDEFTNDEQDIDQTHPMRVKMRASLHPLKQRSPLR